MEKVRDTRICNEQSTNVLQSKIKSFKQLPKHYGRYLNSPYFMMFYV